MKINNRLTGTRPFAGQNSRAVLKKNKKGDVLYDENVWQGISKEAKDLVKAMLAKEPENRITAQEALKYKWFEINQQKKQSKGLEKRICPIQFQRYNLDQIVVKEDSNISLSLESQEFKSFSTGVIEKIHDSGIKKVKFKLIVIKRLIDFFCNIQ